MHQRLEKVDIYAPTNPGPVRNNRSENTAGKSKSRKAHPSAYLTDSDTDEDNANDRTQSAGRGRRNTQYPQDDDILYGAAEWQHNPNYNDEDDEEEVNAIIIKRSSGPTPHARDHHIISAPRMGTKSVNSKLLKHYGEMTDGGRAYDKAGSTKNKMGLKHLLKITKQAVEEHQLNDEAAYALFRKALTGKALEHAIITEDTGTRFRDFFLALQMLNKDQHDKSELRSELDRLRSTKPKDMPSTMMRIHQIHNKLNREADSEHTRMTLVIQLARNDIFDLLRTYYPFLYAQIVDKEHDTKVLYKREQRLLRQSPDNGNELTTRASSHVNELETEAPQTNVTKPKVDVHMVNAQQTPHNNAVRDNSQQRGLTCHGCGGTDHFVRNCPSVPKCPPSSQRLLGAKTSGPAAGRTILPPGKSRTCGAWRSSSLCP